jgi:hypothetical protein
VNISKACKLTRVMNAVAAGTTEQISSVIDMAGFETIAFLVAFGAIVGGAVTSIKVQQGVLADGSDMADLAGSSVTVADTDDNRVAVVEVFRPRERYVRVLIERATQNATIDGAFALQGDARTMPVTQPT